MHDRRSWDSAYCRARPPLFEGKLCRAVGDVQKILFYGKKLVLPDRIELSTSPLPIEWLGFGNFPLSRLLIRFLEQPLCHFCASWSGIRALALSPSIWTDVRLISRWAGRVFITELYHKAVPARNLSCSTSANPFVMESCEPASFPLAQAKAAFRRRAARGAKLPFTGMSAAGGIVLKNSKIEQPKKSRESRSQGFSAAASLVCATAAARDQFG